MTRIPRMALFLGLAGLLPFLWGGLSLWSASLETWMRPWIGSFASGKELIYDYGILIMSFMAGVQWGFSSHQTRNVKTWPYVASVLPVLGVFFAGYIMPQYRIEALLICFLIVYVFDWFLDQNNLTPLWWLRLRTILSIPVFAVLGYAVWA